MDPILSLSIALFQTLWYIRTVRERNRNWCRDREQDQWILTEIFTLIRDRVRHHDPLLPIVLVLFSVLPPVPVIQAIVSVFGTFQGNEKKGWSKSRRLHTEMQF